MISDYKERDLVRMFYAYCRKTLMNARTDIIRKRARLAKKERGFTLRDEETLACEDAAAEENVFSAGEREIVVFGDDIANAIAALDAKAREVILLYYFADWPDRQIAEELGLARSTIQGRRRRALAKLKRHLEEGGDDDEL